MENIDVADVFCGWGQQHQVGGIGFDCYHHAWTVFARKAICFEPKAVLIRQCI